MKSGMVAILIILLASTANADVSLALAWTRDGMVELTFKNTGKTETELEIPFEGSGSCDLYFDVEAELGDGSPARKSMLYAPGIPAFVVKLKPTGLYSHRIGPSAYLNGVDIGSIKKLRVTYTNRLDGTRTTSEWITTANQPSEATR
jgi:hypothetical protein